MAPNVKLWNLSGRQEGESDTEILQTCGLQNKSRTCGENNGLARGCV
jgi:hypothetical protein